MASVHLYLVFSSALYGLVEPEGEASRVLHAGTPALAKWWPLTVETFLLNLADLLLSQSKLLGGRLS